MKEHQEWFKKAKKDFEAAQYNLKGNQFDAGLFFLQQTAEKVLKAVYIKLYQRLLKTHDLVLLSKEVNAPQNIQRACKLLSPLYHQTRYPDTSYKDLYSGTDEFLLAVQEVLQWAEAQLLKS